MVSRTRYPCAGFMQAPGCLGRGREIAEWAQVDAAARGTKDRGTLIEPGRGGVVRTDGREWKVEGTVPDIVVSVSMGDCLCLCVSGSV